MAASVPVAASACGAVAASGSSAGVSGVAGSVAAGWAGASLLLKCFLSQLNAMIRGGLVDGGKAMQAVIVAGFAAGGNIFDARF